MAKKRSSRQIAKESIVDILQRYLHTYAGLTANDCMLPDHIFSDQVEKTFTSQQRTLRRSLVEVMAPLRGSDIVIKHSKKQ